MQKSKKYIHIHRSINVVLDGKCDLKKRKLNKIEKIKLFF